MIGYILGLYRGIIGIMEKTVGYIDWRLAGIKSSKGLAECLGLGSLQPDSSGCFWRALDLEATTLGVEHALACLRMILRTGHDKLLFLDPGRSHPYLATGHLMWGGKVCTSFSIIPT